jgi:hypothetical protein
MHHAFLNEPFWRGPVTIRVFGRFRPGAEGEPDDRDLLPPLEALCEAAPHIRLELLDLSARPALRHEHYLRSFRTVRVFGADGRQVDGAALRELWPPSARVDVDPRPDQFFAQKHGFRARSLEKPIEEYEYTELYALRMRMMAADLIRAPALWFVVDADAREWGPLDRKKLIELSEWGYLDFTATVRCLGQTETQALRDNRATPAPDGTIVPESAEMNAIVAAYRQDAAIRAVRLRNDGSSAPPCPLPVLTELKLPVCLRFAGYDLLAEPFPQMRLHYVSGGEIHLEVRLLPRRADARPSAGEGMPEHEAPCVATTVRGERRAMIEAGLLGMVPGQHEPLLKELAACEFGDGAVVFLRRWQSRAFGHSIAVDERKDVFLLRVLSNGAWVVARLSINTYLGRHFEAAMQPGADGERRDFPAWTTELIEWVEFCALDWERATAGLAPRMAGSTSTMEDSTKELEQVVEPFSPARGEVLWLTDDVDPFEAEARLLRDAGIRVRFVASTAGLLARARHPHVITLVLPLAGEVGGSEALETVRGEFVARRANHRIVAWVPDTMGLGRRRAGVSLCRREKLLATIGLELFRRRYPIHGKRPKVCPLPPRPLRW